MHADEIKRLLRASPFRPFTVFLPSKKAVVVPHEDVAWLTPNGRTLLVAQQDTGGVDHLDVALIVRMEVPQARATGA